MASKSSFPKGEGFPISPLPESLIVVPLEIFANLVEMRRNLETPKSIATAAAISPAAPIKT